MTMCPSTRRSHITLFLLITVLVTSRLCDATSDTLDGDRPPLPTPSSTATDKLTAASSDLKSSESGIVGGGGAGGLAYGAGAKGGLVAGGGAAGTAGKAGYAAGGKGAKGFASGGAAGAAGFAKGAGAKGAGGKLTNNLLTNADN